MFGLSELVVANKRVANLLPNIMFGLKAARLKNNSLSDLIIPRRACGNGLLNSPISDYIIDSKHLKNILSGCDQFERVIRMLLKSTPNAILLIKLMGAHYSG
jgi:hypothetical protein